MARGQLRVLHALDVARTQLYHFTATMIAGMGFFSDAYDLFSISLVAELLTYQYYQGSTPRVVSATINGIALCGAVPGQLVFGWLGDKMGRKLIYGVTLVLMIACSLASGLSFSKRKGKNVVTVLCFFRFWLGVSIGGDYPLSATIMSEYANKRTRGAFIAAVFAMQGFGNLAAGIVGMVVSAAFENSSPSNADFVWRIVLMFGAIPAALTYYWRMKMPETARYTALVAKNAKKAASDMSTVLNVHIIPEEEAVNELTRQDQYGLLSAEFLRRHGIHLLGTTVCWLVLDITFYSLNLFMKDIFTKVGLLPCPDKDNPLKRMIKITEVHTAIALCATLPGYFVTVIFVDRIGRVKIQLLGFTMMSIFILCLAVPYDHWIEQGNKYGFAVMYGMTLFFANFGPNTTTFIIPAEIFPSWLRSTCHGISGAFGKIGAIIGVFGFVNTEKDVRRMLFALVGCNLVGLMFTLLLPESKGKSLEDITGEMEEQQPQDDAAAVAAAECIRVVAI
ncbi:putative inorganic phosphate transporter 1-13 [Phragmites australis]|uniref:putative inorganic phosphate transporter 1-13 n=1 Tax=Phragmites australis TaxID=29695 RepID=UPI002D79E7E7|nr:putative inorganic phosphate transporter 1-13 [Phragmites australis]